MRLCAFAPLREEIFFPVVGVSFGYRKGEGVTTKSSKGAKGKNAKAEHGVFEVPIRKPPEAVKPSCHEYRRRLCMH